MDCFLSRFTTCLSTYMTLFFVAAMFHCFSGFYLTRSSRGVIKIHDVTYLNYNPYLKGDGASLSFNLEADLSGAMNWNTNHLFLYVSIQYNTADSKTNEVIIWDAIVPRSEKAKVKLQNVASKYKLTSLKRDLKGQKVKAIFSYRHMPLIGFMKSYQIASSDFVLPSQYIMTASNDDFY